MKNLINFRIRYHFKQLIVNNQENISKVTIKIILKVIVTIFAGFGTFFFKNKTAVSQFYQMGIPSISVRL